MPLNSGMLNPCKITSLPYRWAVIGNFINSKQYTNNNNYKLKDRRQLRSVTKEELLQKLSESTNKWIEGSTLLPTNAVVKHALVRYGMYQTTLSFRRHYHLTCSPPVRRSGRGFCLPLVPVPASSQSVDVLSQRAREKERDRSNIVHTPHIRMHTSHVSKTTFLSFGGERGARSPHYATTLTEITYEMDWNGS
jgi:hypothetical protein